jgi:obg-like ATPase 1
LCTFCTGAFEGEDVIHIDGDVNPVRDLETISEELRKKVSNSA